MKNNNGKVDASGSGISEDSDPTKPLYKSTTSSDIYEKGNPTVPLLSNKGKNTFND